MADTLDLGSSAAKHKGSSPLLPTIRKEYLMIFAIHAYEEAQGNVVEGDLVVRSIKKRNNRWQNA